MWLRVFVVRPLRGGYEVLTDWAVGLGRERLQDLPIQPRGCPQDPSSSLCLRCSCSSCWATTWFAAQHAQKTLNQFCELRWFNNSCGMKWLNFLSCKDGGGVSLLQEGDKTTNFQSKHLGCRYLIYMGIFELFNLHTHISSQEREWISIVLKNWLKHPIDFFLPLKYKGFLINVWNQCTSKNPAAFVPMQLWSPETAWKQADLSLLLSWSLDVQPLPWCYSVLHWHFFPKMCQFHEQRNSAKWGQV